MERTLITLFDILQKLVGWHRQLLDVVRLEKNALLEMNLKAIHEATYAKEGILVSIQNLESERLRKVAELAIYLKRPPAELTLQAIIIAVQGINLEQADHFRSVFNTLTIMIKRIKDQNADNDKLIEGSLVHIREMKRNVLGESRPYTDTYTQAGQRVTSQGGSRLLLEEA